MATIRWIGGAPAVAQVQTYTFGGTWEATDIVRCEVGYKQLDVVAGSTTTTVVIDAVVAAWNALSAALWPEFAEVTAVRNGNDLVLTAETAGLPFICTLTPLETNLDPADDQTIEGGGVATTGTTDTANEGPNDVSTPENYSGGALPVAADVLIVENSEQDMLYSLEALAGVTVAELRIKRANDLHVGLPEWNSGGYPEYRPRFFKIGATLCEIGEGDTGNGAYRCQLNFSTVQTTCNVYHSRTSREEEGVPVVLLKGTHVANVINVMRGDVGIAVFAGETAVIATLGIGQQGQPGTDAKVVLGSGVTLTTVSKNGGSLKTLSGAATINQLAGDLTLLGSAAVSTALNIDGGVCYDNSTGTKAKVVAGSQGVYDRRQTMKACTVSAAEAYSGYAIHDPMKTVTWSTGIDFVRCSPTEGTLDIGTHLTLTPSAI